MHTAAARFYLIFSAAGLFWVALSYGVAPATFLPKILDVSIEGTDLSHASRAIMGLYLGLIVLWILGAFRPNFTRAAVISEVFFMMGLASGRVLSIVVDGVPSILLIGYTVAEILLGLWGVSVFWKLSTSQLDHNHTPASC